MENKAKDEHRFAAGYMITMEDIVREGDPILQQSTQPVQLPPSQEDRETLQCMMEYLQNSQDEAIAEQYKLRPGVGLSANQIGLNKRMFVAYITDDNDEAKAYTMINPKIISHSVAMIYLPDGEGCLSVDRPVPGLVPRYERITVKGYDDAGKEIQLKLRGYESIVFQHEIDHLDGIMFYDRINKDNPNAPADHMASLY